MALRIPAQLRPRPIALEVPRLTTTRDELVNVTFAVAAVIAVTVVVGDIGLLGSLIGFVFAGLIVLPVSILGHELGHALAVSRLGRRNCMVIVGLVMAGPLLWTIGPLARLVVVLSAEVLLWTLVQSLREHTSATPAGGSGRLLHDGDLARLAFARHQAGIPPAAPSSAIR